jgi:hypothetical protein
MLSTLFNTMSRVLRLAMPVLISTRRLVTLCQAVGEDDQRNQQERRADGGQGFRADGVELRNAAAVFLGDGVGQNHGTRDAQQQSEQHGADQDDPVVARLE